MPPTRLLVIAMLAAAIAAPVASAKVLLNTIDPVAGLAQDGRRLLVAGPIACTAGESAQLRVTVTQRTIGAVALGRGAIACTGAA